jgi:hypothetical protein
MARTLLYPIPPRTVPHDRDMDCEPFLRELLRQSLLSEYESGWRKYLKINGFDKHQVVERESKPKFPTAPSMAL